MSQTRVIDPVGVFFGILLPVLAAGSIVVLARLWEPRLPAEIATHWTGSRPDGFGPVGSSAWTMALLVVMVGGGCCAIAALARSLLMMRRYMLVIGLGVTGLMVATFVAVLGAQLDVADVTQTAFPTWSIAVGTAAGVAVGWLGAALLRDGRERTPASRPPAADLPRGPVESPIVDRVGIGTGATLVLLGSVLVPTSLVGATTDSWLPLVFVVPVAVLAVSLLRFTVIVDEKGIRVRNLATDAVVYDLDEVVGAEITETRPFQDWGGWGLRVKGRGRYGLVTTTGPAVVVTMASGHVFTVTSGRADEMAGALNTLADRRGADTSVDSGSMPEA